MCEAIKETLVSIKPLLARGVLKKLLIQAELNYTPLSLASKDFSILPKELAAQACRFPVTCHLFPVTSQLPRGG
jgi:hypothetical protein